VTEAEFARKLQTLATIAADLNRSSDSINEILTGFEEQIRAMNIGIEVSVETDLGTLDWTKLLRTVKTAGSPHPTQESYWALSINRSPALSASRDHRIAALAAMPELVDKLTREAKSRVEIIEAAKQLLKK
jgi:hypothetical protein